MPLLVVAAGLLAYHNSFTGAFVAGDVVSIPENPTIRHLWPIWRTLSPTHKGGITVEGRPLINLSLAINYALGGYNVWGYHALNLTVHILAGLTLLGIVRRTLLQPKLRGRFGAVANELALAVAVLWTVHPLQTEAVTYIVQRAESLMGLFYLLTLYCFIRGAESPLVARSTRDEPRARLWYGLCVSACVLGMASKEVMVSAPVMVLLYERAFLSGSWREAWRHRWPLYVALAGTWALLGFVTISAGSFGFTSANARHIGLTWWAYLRTEPGVILYYLRLSVWPSPLCLDHPWPIATTWMSILPSALVLAILLGTAVWAWKTNSALGFVGAWFFLILAPSSSVIPLHNPIYEHRMYLSLAAVVSVVVLGLYSLTGRQSLAAFVVVAIGLGFVTWRRNQDYRSDLAIWGDAVAKFPNDPGSHDRLAVALCGAGRFQEALKQWEQALRIKPDFAEAHNNLGLALWQAGQVQEAIQHFEQVLRIQPDFAEAHNNLGVVLGKTGRVREAIQQYEQALQSKPDFAEAHNNLGVTLASTGRMQEAIQQYQQALQIDLDLAQAHENWGNILRQEGKLEEAIGHYQQAVRIKPDYAEAHNSLGNALMRLDRVPEAIEHYEQASWIDPSNAVAHYNLGAALEQASRVPEAIGQYEQAVRLDPDLVEARNDLARLRTAR